VNKIKKATQTGPVYDSLLKMAEDASQNIQTSKDGKVVVKFAETLEKVAIWPFTKKPAPAAPAAPATVPATPKATPQEPEMTSEEINQAYKLMEKSDKLEGWYNSAAERAKGLDGKWKEAKDSTYVGERAAENEQPYAPPEEEYTNLVRWDGGDVSGTGAAPKGKTDSYAIGYAKTMLPKVNELYNHPLLKRLRKKIEQDRLESKRGEEERRIKEMRDRYGNEPLV